MRIGHDEISPGDEDLGRRVLVVARTIAPCLDTLEADDRADALAVLRGVVKDVAGMGGRGIASQRVGQAAVTYTDVRSGFSEEARASLTSLCGLASPAGLPVGSFPLPGVVARLWPEQTYPSAPYSS